MIKKELCECKMIEQTTTATTTTNINKGAFLCCIRFACNNVLNCSKGSRRFVLK